jgi:hypothetical protein
MVVECIEISAKDHDPSDKRYLNLRGEVLTYRRLREHFEAQGEAARRENIVVARYGNTKAGLVVDKLLGGGISDRHQAARQYFSAPPGYRRPHHAGQRRGDLDSGCAGVDEAAGDRRGACR